MNGVIAVFKNIQRYLINIVFFYYYLLFTAVFRKRWFLFHICRHLCVEGFFGLLFARRVINKVITNAKIQKFEIRLKLRSRISVSSTTIIIGPFRVFRCQNDRRGDGKRKRELSPCGRQKLFFVVDTMDLTNSLNTLFFSLSSPGAFL